MTMEIYQALGKPWPKGQVDLSILLWREHSLPCELGYRFKNANIFLKSPYVRTMSISNESAYRV